MFRQFGRWLGRERTIILVATLLITGIASLVLNSVAAGEDWSLTAQTLLVVLFLAVAAMVVGSRLDRPARLRMAFTVGPALGLAILSLIVPRDFFTLVLGLAFGWLIAAQFLMRNQMPQEYRQAVKALRKDDYKGAAKAVGQLISQEPDNINHYRFRAEMHRLSGKMGAAIKDYEKIIALKPDSPVGFTGLSEVYLQQRQYQAALENAEKAYQLDPDDWVAPYNLGMIEDRLRDSSSVINHLRQVLEQGLPDSRHRLLTYLWLARAHYRLGDETTANEVLNRLRREGKGLKEWTVIMEDEQASVLRAVLADDIQLAQKAIQDRQDAATLFAGEAA